MNLLLYGCLYTLICAWPAETFSVVKKVQELHAKHYEFPDSDGASNDWIFNGENGFDSNGVQLKPDDPKTKVRTEQSNRMKMYMDMLADPCEDFYQYACGNWEKNHPIPDDQFEYNMFSLLQENLYKSLKTLLLEKPSGVLDSNNEPIAEDKARHFYAACLDSEMREKHGAKPLLDFLKQQGNWAVLEPNWNGQDFDWMELTARLAKYMPNSLIRTSVDGDLKNSARNIIYLDEPTLSLPRRDIYLKSPNSTYMVAYKQLITEIIQLLGASEELAVESANRIVEFERELAKIKSEQQDRMELEELYNSMRVSELIANYPNIDWMKYFGIVYGPNITKSTTIVLLSRGYMKQLPDLLAKAENKTIASYIMWRYVKELSEDLDSRFEKVHAKFTQQLTGQADTLPKWKTCIQYTNLMMGMAVGAMFVKRHFDETSKADVIQLTRELQQSFRDALRENTWIDQETRAKAEEKANEIGLAVGYPDDILSSEKLNERYRGLIISPTNYFDNSINLAIYDTQKYIENLNKPVDRQEWAGYPAVINAYFEQSNNRIIIPAGILQPPIYNEYFPKALNYGGIGIFVGHELTHGFDDTGRNFDKKGDMKQWWTENSIDAFKKQGECFAEQYSNYSMHGKNINGLISKGENIADNGGLRQAYQAYNKWLEAHPDEIENEFLPGLNITGKKLFYLGFAQVWCGTIRPEAVDNKLETDSHSPGKYRVLGSLRNFEEFSKEFKCHEGTSMNQKNRCKLW